MLIYNYLINNHGNIDVWWEFEFAGALQCAIPRAFAGISLGYFARGVYNELNAKTVMHTHISKVFAFVSGWSLVVISIAMAIFAPHTKYDFVHILILAFIIVLLKWGVQLPIEKLAKKIDAISMPLYIWQIVAIRLVTLTGEQTFIKLIGVLLLDFVICILWLRLSKCWKVNV